MSTFLPLFHPLERHGTTQVSGSSRAGSGPSARSRSRMSSWQAELASTQSAVSSCHSRSGGRPGQSRMSARKSARSSATRSMPVVLDERAVDDEGARGRAGVGRPEPAPQHEVGARGDGRGEVDLQHPEAAHDLEQVGGARGVEQLRPHGDAAGLLPGQSVHHAPTLGERTDVGADSGPDGQSGSPAKTNLR